MQWATVSYLSMSEALRNDYLLDYQHSAQELVAVLNEENRRLQQVIENLRLDLAAAQNALQIMSTPFSRPLLIGNPSQLTVD